MADKMSGNIFDLEIVPTVDMTGVDKLDESLTKWDNEELLIKPVIDKEAEQSLYDALNDFEDYAKGLTIPIEVNIEGDIKQLTKDLRALSKVLPNLSFKTNETNSHKPQVAKKPESKETQSAKSSAKSQSSDSNVDEIKTLKGAEYVEKAVLRINESFDEMARKLKTVNDVANAYEGMLDKDANKARVPITDDNKTGKKGVDSVLKTNYVGSVQIAKEILAEYKAATKEERVAIVDKLKDLKYIPEGTEINGRNIEKVVTQIAKEFKNQFTQAVDLGVKNGLYSTKEASKMPKQIQVGDIYNRNKISDMLDELRQDSGRDLSQYKPEKIDTNVIKSDIVQDLANAISENTQAVNNNTTAESNNLESNKNTTDDLSNKNSNKNVGLKEAFKRMSEAISETNRSVNNLADRIKQFVDAEIDAQNERLAESYAINADNSNPPDNITPSKPNDNIGWSEAEYKLIGNSLLDIDNNVKQASASTDLIFEDVDETKQDIKEAKAIINGIYNEISNGVTVTGGVPIPSSNNSPTPIPQGNNGGTPRNRGGNNPKPANTPPASIRSRDNIIDETNRLIPEIDSEIKKINYLLDSEGGVSDAILSKDDAKDLLNRLKEVESEISNIQNAVWSKKVGQKTLAAADSDLADVMSTYSSINIPQEVDTYNKVFGDSKSIRRAKEMLGTLTRFKELLNTKGIDTTAYDEAIQRLEDGIERVEETKKSWMSQKLDDSGLKLANDALTQVRDSLDGISDTTESLFEYAKNEKSEFLSFDVKIDEVEELEKSLIRLDKLIKKAKFSGVDLTSVDMGNGQTLADAEKTIERYFSEKGSLSIYSPGQFASEDEFKSYREDIELNLIQPTKLYAKTLGETEYAVNQLIQEQKELTKTSNEYNKGLTLNKQISNKITELEKWRDANSKAFTIPENAAEYERFLNRLKDGTIVDQSQMKKFNAEWAEFNAQIRAAGQNGKTTGSILTAMFKKFGGWTLVTRTITQGLRLMKDMVTQVKEVDTAMVNLRKVTDASEQSLLKYQKSVQKSSIALGTTLTDQIDSTATFSRLGYQLEEAQKLGEIASKYKTVAEDLDINTASESIISTMKAYQSMGDTAEEIVDKFNYVGKELPLITISVKGQRCSRPR